MMQVIEYASEVGEAGLVVIAKNLRKGTPALVGGLDEMLAEAVKEIDQRLENRGNSDELAGWKAWSTRTASDHLNSRSKP